MNFQRRNSDTSPLFRKTSVLKFKDKNQHNLLLPLSNNVFLFFTYTHKYNKYFIVF